MLIPCVCGSANELTDYTWQVTTMAVAATALNLDNDDFFKPGIQDKIEKFIKEGWIFHVALSHNLKF